MNNGAGVTGVWTEGAERTSIAVDQCELLAGSLGFFTSFFQGSVICQKAHTRVHLDHFWSIEWSQWNC